jgi:hypothetical protein
MRKILTTFVVCNVLLFCLKAETILQPGDIAVIGYNFKDPDQFSFIFLNNVEAGTIIYITDCGYDAEKGSFREGEGIVTYTVPVGGRRTGDVVTYPDDGNFKTQGVSGFFGLSVDGDQLFIFQGSFNNPVFIFGLSVYNGDWQTTGINNNNSTLPPGLENGLTAIALTKQANASFNCSRITDWGRDAFLKSLTIELNWDRSQVNRFSLPEHSCLNSVLSYKPSKTTTVQPDQQTSLIFSSGYILIEVYTAEGRYIGASNNLLQVLSQMDIGNIYIFKVYYPDRLEIKKIIR